jgi:hypothetical protein
VSSKKYLIIYFFVYFFDPIRLPPVPSHSIAKAARPTMGVRGIVASSNIKKQPTNWVVDLWVVRGIDFGLISM